MDNKIRELRLKKGWSQKKLAKAVGTSQQQIQRFETGAPVKLQMAGVLAEALGVSVPTVFPGSRLGLERVLRKGSIAEAYTNEEIEDSLLNAGIESDPVFWTARVLLRGADPAKDIRFYKIGVADRKRVDRHYLGIGNQPPGFFHFESEDKVVLVNMDHVVFWQNCWDPPTIVEQEKEPFCGLDVYFAGKKEALCFGVEPDGPAPESPDGEDEDGQFRWLTMHLEAGLDKDDFIDFEDEDGEVAHLRVGDIAVIEMARYLTHPELLDDIEEARMKARMIRMVHKACKKRIEKQ